MPIFAFRFNLAAILLAGVLTVLGMSAANAGGASGGVLGDKKHASGERHRTGGQPGGATAKGGRGDLGGDF
jgi:hypothetical protein